MNYEFTGKLIVKENAIQVSDKFRKREFVLEHTESNGNNEWVTAVKFQLTQDRCSLIETININDEITVHFNLRGNKWVKDDKTNYFNNLDVWKIDAANNATSANTAPVDNIPPGEDDEDSLPF